MTVRPGRCGPTSTALEQRAIADGRDIGAVGVYLPVADGQILTFTRIGESDVGCGNSVDAETGSVWKIQGQALSGPLSGERLERVEHLDTFWFARAVNEPDNGVVNP